MSTVQQQQQQQVVNGIDTLAVRGLIDQCAADAAKAQVRFGVTTAWQHGTVSQTRVDDYEIGGQRVAKDFRLRIDEPLELGGTNTAANPQEYLMSAFNACMLVGYVVGASVRGIELEKLEIACQGQLDLRGFLGIDPAVKPGYDRIHYTVTIKGNGTREQFESIHRDVIATSPNRWNIANPIRLTSDLVVE